MLISYNIHSGIIWKVLFHPRKIQIGKKINTMQETDSQISSGSHVLGYDIEIFMENFFSNICSNNSFPNITRKLITMKIIKTNSEMISNLAHIKVSDALNSLISD